MSQLKAEEQKQTNRTHTWIVILLSVIINGLVTILIFVEGGGQTFNGFDLTILPMMNAIFNSFTTVFLLGALYFILRKNIKMHRRFIYGAFTTTTLFLVTYLAYHSLASSTSYGGEGIIQYVYYFILISHIILAALIVPLSIYTFLKGFTYQVQKHRKIARWTMPLWLYVSITGVVVYFMIAPYY
ncbi:DUF420 domain-containing protein [Marinococcus sp. PL1-022]|uniref:DUF420 domain-containing protein n=1 Tax=Marinococcus sp. PL1-022 TaxID=3095363 RepID=UPI0026366869|nr:DUF420 domain-containing protein [Marinococcus sp. PL1-022]MDX6152357.1 DUF420 domain-containing protein [Marinococcus sp. PL1-022]